MIQSEAGKILLTSSNFFVLMLATIILNQVQVTRLQNAVFKLQCLKKLLFWWFMVVMAGEEQVGLPRGPIPGVSYPISVVYCGNCSLPIEYCEFYPDNEKCKSWLEKHLPNEFQKIVKLTGEKEEDGAGGGAGEEEKKRQKRGGKGMVKPKKKEEVAKQVTVSRAARGKKKSVTVVTGLSTFDIDLKVAAKFFGTKFACGSSVTGDDEIVIQGDVKDDLFDVIPEKWPEIDEDLIEDLGDQKR